MSLASQITALVTRIGTEFKALRAVTGDLANLTTTDKTTLVAAINEAASTGGTPGEATITPNPVIVATAGQTVFAIPGGTAATQVRVYASGLKLEPATDYTVAVGGASYTLTEAAEAGEEFSTEVITQFNVADTYTQAQIDAKLEQAGSPEIKATVVNGFIISANTITTATEVPAGYSAMRAGPLVGGVGGRVFGDGRLVIV